MASTMRFTGSISGATWRHFPVGSIAASNSIGWLSNWLMSPVAQRRYCIGSLRWRGTSLNQEVLSQRQPSTIEGFSKHESTGTSVTNILLELKNANHSLGGDPFDIEIWPNTVGLFRSGFPPQAFSQTGNVNLEGDRLFLNRKPQVGYQLDIYQLVHMDTISATVGRTSRDPATGKRLNPILLWNNSVQITHVSVFLLPYNAADERFPARPSGSASRLFLLLLLLLRLDHGNGGHVDHASHGG